MFLSITLSRAVSISLETLDAYPFVSFSHTRTPTDLGHDSCIRSAVRRDFTTLVVSVMVLWFHLSFFSFGMNPSQSRLRVNDTHRVGTKPNEDAYYFRLFGY